MQEQAAMTGGRQPENTVSAADAVETLLIEGELRRPRAPGRLHRALDRSRAALKRLSHGSLVHSLRLRGSFPLKLLSAPADLWPGDAERGADMAAGRWRWGDYRVDGPLPPYGDPQAPLAYRAYLHGFSWLRDLAAINDRRRAQALAEPALRAWLHSYSGFDPLAWRADLIGDRIGFWTAYAPLILANHDLVYRSKVLNTLARQGRHLARVAAGGDGMAGLRAIAGLIQSGLLLPGGGERLRNGNDLLDQALARRVLVDGGFMSRNPDDIHRLLRLLISLRAVYRDREAEPPKGLQNAIDRMVPMLKGLMLADGTLARFHGAGAARPRDLALSLDLAEAGGKPIENAALSGYQRLARGPVVLLVDAGPPPARPFSAAGHAAPLAFELSVGGQRLIVNCGTPAPDAREYAELAGLMRGGAAHSTLTVNDANAARIAKDGGIGRGVAHTRWQRRESGAGIWLDLAHDGYAARLGVSHHRRFYLAGNGLDLRGEDQLVATGRSGWARWFGRRATSATLRFHLHPEVEAALTRDGQAAILRLADHHGWMFRAEGATLQIEDSLYLGGDGPRRCRQLVLTAEIAALPLVVNWSLRALDPA